MMPSFLYKVGDHEFSVAFKTEALAQRILPLMDNYSPFQIAADATPCEPAVFELNVEPGAQGKTLALEFTEDIRQNDEGQTIVCGHTATGESVFKFYAENIDAGMLVCKPGYHEATLYLGASRNKFSIDNALMILYAMATSNLATALFHAAVVSYNGRGYMFLGKSGTGKSTHARLWLANIPGTKLVNDDNPVVRIKDGVVTVYGSPWSGKTPCYKNVSMPLGAVVQLAQAPYNKISRLGGLQAYAALVPSISGKRWDKKLADGLHETENRLAMNAAAYYLECLPDAAAAMLCAQTIAGWTLP